MHVCSLVEKSCQLIYLSIDVIKISNELKMLFVVFDFDIGNQICFYVRLKKLFF